MKKSNLPTMAALCSAVLFSGIFLGIYMPSHHSDANCEIVLPKDEGTGSLVQQTNSGSQQNSAYSDIQIDTENVQAVIASMERPAAYSVCIQSTLYYDNSSTNMVCRQYVKDGFSRINYLGNGTGIQFCSVFGESGYYSWKYGSSTYYYTKDQHWKADTYAMLPTYEDVLKLDSKEITEAKLINIHYKPCIEVSSQKDKEYSYTYIISAETGLLVQANYYKNGEKIRQVTLSEFSDDTPDDSYFQLPNGTLVLT